MFSSLLLFFVLIVVALIIVGAGGDDQDGGPVDEKNSDFPSMQRTQHMFDDIWQEIELIDVHYPVGDWVTHGAWVKVSGTSFYNAMDLVYGISMLQDSNLVNCAKIVLRRDPTNKYDKNAVKVFGQCKNKSLWQLGHLPRYTVQHLNERYHFNMPINAVIEKLAVNWGENACSIKLRVLIPSAKKRKMYVRND